MATATGLSDSGYFIPSRTVLYTAVVDTAAPDASILDNPGTPWKIAGHIGDEAAKGNVSFTRDGGDVTVKGSITKKAIRQIVDPVTTGFDVDITQWTRYALSLYTGTDGGTGVSTFQVEGSSDGLTTQSAALVVWEDGLTRVGLYAPKVGWSGRDNIDTDSIEDAVVIPLHAGFLDSNTLTGPTGKPLRYTWISPTLLLAS